MFQDFSLLAGTIAENVAQTENFDLKQVKNCIKKAGLLPKIEALPDKYQTFLNREVYKNAIMFSGGETQRLMLARALYKDAPFIILDEPTAALDSIAEADIYQKYDEMTKGKILSLYLPSARFYQILQQNLNAGAGRNTGRRNSRRAVKAKWKIRCSL